MFKRIIVERSTQRIFHDHERWALSCCEDRNSLTESKSSFWWNCVFPRTRGTKTRSRKTSREEIDDGEGKHMNCTYSPLWELCAKKRGMRHSGEFPRDFVWHSSRSIVYRFLSLQTAWEIVFVSVWVADLVLRWRFWQTLKKDRQKSWNGSKIIHFTG